LARKHLVPKGKNEAMKELEEDEDMAEMEDE
jgi:hypothetical protein